MSFFEITVCMNILTFSIPELNSILVFSEGFRSHDSSKSAYIYVELSVKLFLVNASTVKSQNYDYQAIRCEQHGMVGKVFHVD